MGAFIKLIELIRRVFKALLHFEIVTRTCRWDAGARTTAMHQIKDYTSAPVWLLFGGYNGCEGYSILTLQIPNVRRNKAPDYPHLSKALHFVQIDDELLNKQYRLTAPLHLWK